MDFLHHQRSPELSLWVRKGSVGWDTHGVSASYSYLVCILHRAMSQRGEGEESLICSLLAKAVTYNLRYSDLFFATKNISPTTVRTCRTAVHFLRNEVHLRSTVLKITDCRNHDAAVPYARLLAHVYIRY